MQAVLLCDAVGCSRCNALLRTDLSAFPAADALPGDLVTFWRAFSLSKRIRLPENGLHTQMEILDPHIPDNKDDSDFPRGARIHIGKIRLFLKNKVDTAFLFRFWYRNGLCGYTDHLFIPGIRQYLYLSVVKKFTAKFFSARSEKIKRVRSIMDGADTARLRCSV